MGYQSARAASRKGESWKTSSIERFFFIRLYTKDGRQDSLLRHEGYKSGVIKKPLLPSMDGAVTSSGRVSVAISG